MKVNGLLCFSIILAWLLLFWRLRLSHGENAPAGAKLTALNIFASLSLSGSVACSPNGNKLATRLFDMQTRRVACDFF
jgi:hypothetical protein